MKSYAEEIKNVLKSGEYLKRLKEIHEHYPNVKSEHRYRDAFLEVFNDTYDGKGIKAYAEVKKVDLVIVDTASNSQFRIEFKYQYTFDMYAETSRIKAFEGLCERVENGDGGVAELILKDCKKCHFLILIVQDRTGHQLVKALPENLRPNFIADQLRLDRDFKPRTETNLNSWLEPTLDLLRKAAEKFGGELLPTLPLEVSEATSDNPLTSHFFMLGRSGVDPQDATAHAEI
ncbi:hypothetical protein PQR70_14025 [Paraburkholderia madseniana]|uniref:hypothetical protein n=1 Tax=Paraburkholderia madseniana TaxID=2599607 RepID=UPI0038B99001